MATILLIEDVLDIGAYEARLLEERGHRVVICRGGPGPFSACPLVRDGTCGIADHADMIVFSTSLFAPVGTQSHRGMDLLRAYREHPAYGAKPCLVVAVGTPGPMAGTGPIRTIAKFAAAHQVVAAAEDLLVQAGRGPTPDRVHRP